MSLSTIAGLLDFYVGSALQSARPQGMGAQWWRCGRAGQPPPQSWRLREEVCWGVARSGKYCRTAPNPSSAVVLRRHPGFMEAEETALPCSAKSKMDSHEGAWPTNGLWFL
ncbi:hypothetical protein L7F22_060594 [Adiantum nelumboides]|nr:hypothetical protein [Adiantum nelumboides]